MRPADIGRGIKHDPLQSNILYSVLAWCLALGMYGLDCSSVTAYSGQLQPVISVHLDDR